MTDSGVRHERVLFDNQEFAICHLIDDCPPFTVVRELTKNAIEAAVGHSPPGRIEWFSEIVDGVPKIGLFNEGPGMSESDLRRYTNFASSGKVQGLEAHYGHGGKVSALKVSPIGVIYRSCQGGRVRQVVLFREHQPGRDYPVTVRLRQFIDDADGQSWEVVLDVTDAYQGRLDRPLDRDWTEVLLMGRDRAQNTVAELIPGRTSKTWLIRGLNTRFYRLPDGVKISQANLVSARSNSEPRNAPGLEELVSRWTDQSEYVLANHPEFGPVKIRYAKLKGSCGQGGSAGTAAESRSSTMAAYGVGSRGDHVCLVYRDECYEVQTGWVRLAGAFGILYGSSDVAVHVLLPDGAPVKDTTYRDGLIRRSDNSRVHVEEFAGLVHDHRPDWLKEYIESLAQRDGSSDMDLMDRLKQFMDEFRADPEVRKKVRSNGVEEGERPNDTPDRPRPDEPPLPRPRPPRPKPTVPGIGTRSGTTRGIPEVRFTDDAGILSELADRAALYRREDNTVFLSREFFRYQQDRDLLFDRAGSDADVRQYALKLFEDAYKYRAGCFVIMAWVFKGRPAWTDSDLDQALSQGALTVYLTSREAYREAEAKLSQKLHAGRRRERGTP
jgi:hypothetical protein